MKTTYKKKNSGKDYPKNGKQKENKDFLELERERRIKKYGY